MCFLSPVPGASIDLICNGLKLYGKQIKTNHSAEGWHATRHSHHLRKLFDNLFFFFFFLKKLFDNHRKSS